MIVKEPDWRELIDKDNAQTTADNLKRWFAMNVTFSNQKVMQVETLAEALEVINTCGNDDKCDLCEKFSKQILEQYRGDK